MNLTVQHFLRHSPCVVTFRVLMVLQAQLGLQDREALWVFLVREESAGCPVFQDLRYVLLKSGFIYVQQVVLLLLHCKISFFFPGSTRKTGIHRYTWR